MSHRSTGGDEMTAAGSASHDHGEGDPLLRRAKVRAAAKAWTSQLIDLSGRNTLLHYRDLKQGTLDLGVTEPVALESLLAGQTVRLSTLFPGPAATSAARRARTIRAKAAENFEERGLQTLFLGWGLATWTNTRGTATPAAPVLLRLGHLAPRGSSGEEFDVSLPGDWEVNPTLLHLLAVDHQVVLDGDSLLDLLDDDGPDAPDPTVLFERLTKEASPALAGFAVSSRVILGNFSYAKLPMVKDIEAAEDVLVESDTLSAIAGDERAREALRDRGPSVDMSAPDHTPPHDEFLVLDADASQSYVINAAVQGSDLVVEGPPGTGKSQTIANLIASLAARRQRVLFVAEKRAAIDAVLDRLSRAALGDLVMDLHDATVPKRRLAADLSKALADASAIPLPNLTATHQRLVSRRDVLRTRVEALHMRRAPWGVSVAEIESRLLGIGVEANSDARLRGEALAALDDDAFTAAREELRDFAALGGLSRSRSPWASAAAAGTVSSSEQAQAALHAASNLVSHTIPASREVLDQAVAECGVPEPAHIEDWTALLDLLHEVAALLSRFEPAIFELDLKQVGAALDPAARSGGSRMVHQMSDSTYREAKRQVRAVARTKNPTATLLRAVVAADSQLARWRAVTGNPSSVPQLPADLGATAGAFTQLRAEVEAVAGWAYRGDLGQMNMSELEAFARSLVNDQVALARLPELFRLFQGLKRRGLGPLVEEMRRRSPSTSTALECLDFVWLSSILETVQLTDPRIGAFDGAAHSSTVIDFQEADVAHIRSASQRVRRAVAERITAARDAFPEESAVIEREARLKQRHMPLRQLFQKAPNVLGALKPCWAMSPLVVAQLLPAQKCFDVVIFDEASQVTPADAVGALLRADRAVVAGDPHQLPPTSFFSTSGGGEDDEEHEHLEGPQALTTDMESVLDVMATLLPRPIGTRVLGWHYRSEDERLIAFSNAQPTLYDWSLTTFPGVLGHESLRHELVPWTAGRIGQEESVGDEVLRVVGLVQEHARQRPEESLGIITMGIKHANRINEALRRARLDDEQLDRFCDEAAPERLFIKNLERVQGDERDAIILSIGYGKGPDGRMRYFFGPLNQAGGERRLNVAITRARKRMTLVSSFAAQDMDPNKLNAEGAQMLHRYLEYAGSHGGTLGSFSKDKPDLNPFERDVRDVLIAAGIPLLAQHGCSGYWIDFAAQHPTRPGEMVLAIECDGVSYHSSPTARDRDRLRQEHLERLGWTFHRIWSSEWFRHREAEIERAVAAYEAAVAISDAPPGEVAEVVAERSTKPEPETETPPQRTVRPYLPPGQPIGYYRHEDLVRLIRWIDSDTLLRTEDELLREAMEELGFARRGAKILAALSAAIQDARPTGRY